MTTITCDFCGVKIAANDAYAATVDIKTHVRMLDEAWTPDLEYHWDLCAACKDGLLHFAVVKRKAVAA